MQKGGGVGIPLLLIIIILKNIIDTSNNMITIIKFIITATNVLNKNKNASL